MLLYGLRQKPLPVKQKMNWRSKQSPNFCDFNMSWEKKLIFADALKHCLPYIYSTSHHIQFIFHGSYQSKAGKKYKWGV